MAYYRDPKVQARYDAQLKNPEEICPFCELDPKREILEQTETYYIVANQNPYDLWDLHRVEDHLLLIPRAHVSSISELQKDALTELAGVMSRYESEGYSIYARAPQNQTKTVVHQHTHLIKTSGPELSKMTYNHIPYDREVEFH
jgi:diadenosine tetraphosphate (Ap4A) HIT family hydrolase